MTKSILKVILLCVIYATANSVYCQTDWQSYQTEKPLPEKAKIKTVKYNSYGYAAVGYVIDKQFVEGQSLTFYNTKTETNYIPIYVFPIPINSTKLTNPIISGTYFVKDGISYLESTIKKVGDSRYSSSNFSLRGVFRVTNSFDEKRLTAKTKEAKELKIKTEDIIECLGFYRNSRNPVILQKDSNNNYLYKIKFDDRILEAVITKNYLIKDFFPVVDNLIKNTESSSNKYGFPLVFDNHLKSLNDVKLTYNNGDFFIGKVDEYNNADEGKYLFSNGEIFIGKCNKYQKIWEVGEWKFTDGSLENGNWLEKYGVSADDLSSVETLTDKHKLAIRIYEGKKEKEKKEKEKEEKEKEEKMKWKAVPVNNEFGSLQKCYVNSPRYNSNGKFIPALMELIIYPPFYGENATPMVRFVLTDFLIGTAIKCNIAIQTPDERIIRFNQVNLFNQKNLYNISTTASAQLENKDASEIVNILRNFDEIKISISAIVTSTYGNEEWNNIWTVGTKTFIEAYNETSNCCLKH